jgi:hypothetical protein
MPKQPEVEQQASSGQQAAAQLAATLGAYVLRVLGRPVDLYAVQVHLLWPDHYRVNVLVGVTAAEVKVAHSYFLVMDGNGNLGSSDPEITGEYAPGTVEAAGGALVPGS